MTHRIIFKLATVTPSYRGHWENETTDLHNGIILAQLQQMWRAGALGAFHGRVWGSVPGLGGLKETKMFLPHPRIVGSLRDQEVASSALDRQGSNF